MRGWGLVQLVSTAGVCLGPEEVQVMVELQQIGPGVVAHNEEQVLDIGEVSLGGMAKFSGGTCGFSELVPWIHES